VEGARLAGRDIRAAHVWLATLRARHVRAAHDTWGVALGFVLRVIHGGRAVRVGPGVAYDARGRVLLLAHDRDVTVPAGAFPLVLALRHAAPEPGIRWRWGGPDRPLALGLDIPLGQLTAPTALELAVRRHARAIVGPQVGAGRLARGAAAGGAGAAWTVDVDTSSAGFRRTPFYVVTAVPVAPAVLGPFVEVSGAAPDRFAATVRLAGNAAPPSVTDGARRLPVSLDWIGVEPAPVCALPPRSDVEPSPCLP
jgi:hypothetical protein